MTYDEILIQDYRITLKIIEKKDVYEVNLWQ